MGILLAAALLLWSAAVPGAEPGREAEVVTAASVTETTEETAPTGNGGRSPQRIVVTATRIDTPIENVPNSVSVITSETIVARQYRNAIDAMSAVPGISIRQSGGLGKQASMFIRGLDSQYAKVMLDGMPLNDPSTPRGAYDFGQMTTDNLAQLEVLRGPQSLLYGSNAVGGVINAVSRKGEGPLSGYVRAEGGSFGTGLTQFGLQAGNDRGDFSLGGSALTTDGVSALSKHRFGFSEKDGYEQGSLSLRLGANVSDNLRFDLFGYAQWAKYDFDTDAYDTTSSDNLPYDDPNLTGTNERYMIRPQVTWTLFDGKWEQKAGVGYMTTKRKYRDGDESLPSNMGVFLQRSRYRGETWKFDYQSTIRLVEWNAILAGVDVTRETYEFQDSYYGPAVSPTTTAPWITNTGVFIEDQVQIGDAFTANLGIRNDHHEEFGDHVTWRGGASYRLPSETRIRGSVGTGFRAPSVNELYGNTYTLPNHDLKPETSLGWDAGLEQSLFDGRLSLGGTYFENRIKDMIVNPTYAQYENVSGTTETWGVEAFFSFEIIENVSLSGNYTWTRARNREISDDRSVRVRRPLHEAALNLDWKFLEKGTFTAGVKYVSRRWDYDFYSATSPVRMPSHATFRLGAAWKFNEHVEVFGRVENLFNKKYEDIRGYGTPGIGAYAGAALSF
jgi:vitamin B12 transporter